MRTDRIPQRGPLAAVREDPGAAALLPGTLRNRERRPAGKKLHVLVWIIMQKVPGLLWFGGCFPHSLFSKQDKQQNDSHWRAQVKEGL